jgi:hypothetical protein
VDSEREAMETEAWLFRRPFVRQKYGKLQLIDGQLSFTLDNGEVVFAEPLARVSCSFPWYYFGGAMKVRRKGERSLTINFAGNTTTGVPGLPEFQLGRGLRAGKAWRQTLQDAQTNNGY